VREAFETLRVFKLYYRLNRESKLNVNNFWEEEASKCLVTQSMLVRFRVSQSVEWNDMSSRRLATAFVPNLLRPTHQYIM